MRGGAQQERENYGKRKSWKPFYRTGSKGGGGAHGAKEEGEI